LEHKYFFCYLYFKKIHNKHYFFLLVPRPAIMSFSHYFKIKSFTYFYWQIDVNPTDMILRPQLSFEICSTRSTKRYLKKINIKINASYKKYFLLDLSSCLYLAEWHRIQRSQLEHNFFFKNTLMQITSIAEWE
jgi:hypothetical protein